MATPILLKKWHFKVAKKFPNILATIVRTIVAKTLKNISIY